MCIPPLWGNRWCFECSNWPPPPPPTVKAFESSLPGFIPWMPLGDWWTYLLLAPSSWPDCICNFPSEWYAWWCFVDIIAVNLAWGVDELAATNAPLLDWWGCGGWLCEWWCLWTAGACWGKCPLPDKSCCFPWGGGCDCCCMRWLCAYVLLASTLLKDWLWSLDGWRSLCLTEGLDRMAWFDEDCTDDDEDGGWEGWWWWETLLEEALVVLLLELPGFCL